MSGWEKLQVGAGCKEPHKQRCCYEREVWEILKRIGNVLAAGSNTKPRVRGDGKETSLGIQRVLSSQEVTSSC